MFTFNFCLHQAVYYVVYAHHALKDLGIVVKVTNVAYVTIDRTRIRTAKTREVHVHTHVLYTISNPIVSTSDLQNTRSNTVNYFKSGRRFDVTNLLSV